ncbi:hypothetical protein HNY73_013712 [Argiope bruennichi]|uniref:Peptidase aspartic putative domain-containing protein n=1 Tax=Argiope bruennichi TaxID=94029 RepID=A0A8T0EQW4_ARGBR|nr:hypothetical protein HNY73_013712 [Argiope bruennichi]
MFQDWTHGKAVYKCQKKHFNVMCPEMKHFESTGSGKIVDKAMENSKKKFNTSVNPTCSADILLQTLVVYLYGNGGRFPVRALIDTRIQKSYITKEAVSKLSYEQIRAEDMIHNLFGGVETYDQETIFIDISKAISGPWTKEIEEKGIFLSDKEACLYDSTSSVHLLIGVDIADKQFTGKIGNLSCGLVAMETLLGWTVMGKSENEVKNDSYMTVLSLHVNNKSISDLWSLDTLGILDSADKQGKIEIEKETEKLVLNSVKQDGDGRYVVSLPWLEDHPVLPSNKTLAEKRLKNTVDRIKNLGILQDYENVFEDWKKEEKKKSVVTSLFVSDYIREFLIRFSSFDKLIRVTERMIRFCRNSKLAKSCRVTDILTPDELKEAETKILLIVQKLHLFLKPRPKESVVELIKGKDGIVRLVKVCTKQGDLLRPIQCLYPLEVSSPIYRELCKGIEDPVICDEGEHHNPSDSSAPVPVSQEATSSMSVSPEELLPTSQP